MTDAVDIAGNEDETSLPALWEAAAYFMRWLIAMCGGPCALVAGGYLSLKERRQILFWLRPVEAVVRRLLVAEAARIAQRLHSARTQQAQAAAKPMQAARKNAQNWQRRAARPRFCRVSFPDPENSAGWTVRFSASEPAGRMPRSAPRFEPRLRVLDGESDAHILAPAALALAAARHRERLRAGEPVLSAAPARRLKPSRAAGNPWALAKRIEALIRVLSNPEPYARRLARRLRTNAARLAHACRPPPERPPGQRPRYGEETLRRAGERALEALAAFDPG